jgi:ribosomal protein S19E (S16A)
MAQKFEMITGVTEIIKSKLNKLAETHYVSVHKMTTINAVKPEDDDWHYVLVEKMDIPTSSSGNNG